MFKKQTCKVQAEKKVLRCSSNIVPRKLTQLNLHNVSSNSNRHLKIAVRGARGCTYFSFLVLIMFYLFLLWFVHIIPCIDINYFYHFCYQRKTYRRYEILVCCISRRFILWIIQSIDS